MKLKLTTILCIEDPSEFFGMIFGGEAFVDLYGSSFPSYRFFGC
jgi:hypothetical protein